MFNISNGVKDPHQEFRVESYVTPSVSLEGDFVFRAHNTLTRVVESNQGDVSSDREQGCVGMEISKNL